jgi:hypothetical protein
MTAHDVTIAGYLTLFGVALALQLAARRGVAGVPRFEAVIARAVRTRPGRMALVTAWAWLGLHFFAR